MKKTFFAAILMMVSMVAFGRDYAVIGPDDNVYVPAEQGQQQVYVQAAPRVYVQREVYIQQRPMPVYQPAPVYYPQQQPVVVERESSVMPAIISGVLGAAVGYHYGHRR